jgi:hypothetical protein
VSTRSTGRAVLAYNVLRLGLLAAALGVFFLAGIRGFPLVLLSLLVSGVLSWFLLRRQRAVLADALAARTRQRVPAAGAPAAGVPVRRMRLPRVRR